MLKLRLVRGDSEREVEDLNTSNLVGSFSVSAQACSNTNRFGVLRLDKRAL